MKKTYISELYFQNLLFFNIQRNTRDTKKGNAVKTGSVKLFVDEFQITSPNISKYQTLQHAYPRDFRKFSGKEDKHVVNFSAKVNMANSEADQHIILKQTLVENLAATLSFNPQERVIAEEQIKILEVNDSK